MPSSQPKETKKRKPAIVAQPADKEAADAAALVAAAQSRYVADVRTRQESAPLKDGKLPLGKTHIERGKGLPPKRARYTLTG